MFMDNKHKIVQILSDGEFHSGEVIGEQLGISRAAVSGHIKSLSNIGLDIFSITGKGYQLAGGLSLLDLKKIKQNCSVNNELELFPVIPSTNEYLMGLIKSKTDLSDGHTILAECQTQGKGRRGRTWQSPYGSHVYLSQYRTMDSGLSAASSLSLAIGLAVLNTINAFSNKKCELKWPNDLLVEGKKIAGILVEAEGQADGVCHLVIGVGINIDMPKASALDIEQPWTDLNTITDNTIDRNQFIAKLLEQLESVYQEYSDNRLDNLANQWNQNNAFVNQIVELRSTSKVQVGKCLGIDTSGALLLEDLTTKVISKIFGGEVSLRKKKVES
ncbi:bifunctional ligase/repressor BirA [Psychrosphaera saromensis]|uniref:Bifunctional ligase/repressor BirA n=2 Tax=Psychrosphaera saromensis TaxID=716813 RepID=A0A2S7URV3_9GAMM|nr:biotin--[acetyl-CoA-carboxylase] ligase [Psychrosphaera saromensis]GHB80143.1 bifunctional ligase/repressor BirA [Psychrosphaera saromensis]GLQ14692.1 bifunctional ligase/repressor BirA [Psychrosphaera saromensis]